MIAYCIACWPIRRPVRPGEHFVLCDTHAASMLRPAPHRHVTRPGVRRGTTTRPVRLTAERPPGERRATETRQPVCAGSTPARPTPSGDDLLDLVADAMTPRKAVEVRSELPAEFRRIRPDELRQRPQTPTAAAWSRPAAEADFEH